MISETFKFTCVTDEVKPLLPHLNPDDALSPQLRVDGGELSSESVIVDHFLDKASKFSINHTCIHQDSFDSIFTLVALCRATSAKLQDFDQDVNMEPEVLQSFVSKKEQALKRLSFIKALHLCAHLSGKSSSSPASSRPQSSGDSQLCLTYPQVSSPPQPSQLVEIDSSIETHR